jgi:VanZ family protein
MTSATTRVRAIDAALWTATAVCGGLTVWLSLVTSPPGTSTVEGIDKLEHLVAYATTVSLFLLAAVWRPGRGPGALWGVRNWVLPLAVVAAGAIEIVQGSIGREQEFADWVSGSLGAGLAVWANVALRRR